MNTPTCKTCEHSAQCVNGTYCCLHHKLVEYKRTPCRDYAEKKNHPTS